MKREAHLLKASKNKERPSRIVYFDTESRVVNDEHNPFLICACFSRFEKKRGRSYDKWKDYYKGDFIEDFWHDVVKYVQHKKMVYVINHNIGYDIITIAGIPHLGKYGFRVVSFFEKGNVFIMKMRYDEKDEKGENISGKSKTIMFISSTNYYSAPLRDIGKLFGLDKLDYDYDNGTIEDGLVYCQRDVEIVKLAMEKFFEFVDINDLGCVARTISGQAFNAFTHRFLQYEVSIHTSEKACKLERESYYGGRVECWRIGRLPANKTYYYLDVNSMYPYVMKSFSYPVELIGYRVKNTVQDIANEIEKGYGVIAKVRVKTDLPVFPYRTKSKLIFPIGEFTTTLCTPELKFGLEHNLIVEVKEASYYTVAPIFADYVQFFYENRLVAKANKDKIHDLMYKLFLNGLYGKFGQLADNYEICGEDDINKIGVEYEYNADTGEKRLIKTFGGTRFEKVGEDESFNSFPAVAAHVTSQARQHLFKYIMQAGIKNVLYMDTDSMFVTEEGYKRCESILSGKILGAMKLEQSSNDLKINAPKNYHFGEIDKSKGIKTNKYTVSFFTENTEITNYLIVVDHELNEQGIYDYLTNLFPAVRNIKLIDSNIGVKKLSEQDYIIWQWPKLSSFIREGNLSQYKNKWVKKHISNNYEKGILLPTGEVTPFTIKEVIS
jgi:hypothetical protein